MTNYSKRVKLKELKDNFQNVKPCLLRFFLIMWITKQLMVAIDFHSMENNNVEVNGYCLVTKIKIKITFFCAQQQKETHRFGTMRGWEIWVNDVRIFGWTIPLITINGVQMFWLFNFFCKSFWELLTLILARSNTLKLKCHNNAFVSYKHAVFHAQDLYW